MSDRRMGVLGRLGPGTLVAFVLLFGIVVGEAGAQSRSNGRDPEERYVDYSDRAFAEADDARRVYFFHAGWCPTCRTAHRNFTRNVDRIPGDVVVFRVDYDSNRELRRRFGVTYQHTYVLVDEEGELVRRWSGGDIDQLIRNLRDDS